MNENQSPHSSGEARKAAARFATLRELTSTLAVHLSPVPSAETLRQWFDRANVPRIKANPAARRGGGPVYYSVSGVEKLLRSRAIPGRLNPLELVAKGAA